MKRAIGFAVVAVMVLLPAGASAMSLSFSWGPTKKCFDGKSPPMRLSAVPRGTAKLSFRMTDLDAPGFNHGGGTVRYSGKNRLAYGAFSYRGPCPPTRHTYQFTVRALDKSGKTLASARARRSFP